MVEVVVLALGDIVPPGLDVLGNIVTVQHQELPADPRLVQDQLHQVKVLLSVTGLVLSYGQIMNLLSLPPHLLISLTLTSFSQIITLLILSLFRIFFISSS